MALEVERAWREHDPAQGRVPLWVKEKLRDFKRSLEPEDAAIEAQFFTSCGLPSAIITDLIHRGVTRQRVARLEKLFPGAVISSSRDLLNIRWLAPRGPLIASPRHPGELQNCTVVRIALIAPRGLWLGWLAEVPDHAAHRYIEYTPTTDLRAALFEVAAVFAAADFSSVVNVMVKQRSIYLPAGDGVFAGDVVRGRIEKTDKVLWYCRPRTYFTAAMMASHHRPIAAASSPDRSVAAAVLQIAFPNVGERKCA